MIGHLINERSGGKRYIAKIFHHYRVYRIFSFTDAFKDATRINPQFSGPLRDTAGYAINGYIPVGPSVFCLFASTRPYAVIRRVAAHIILSLQRFTDRCFAHVLKKVFKVHPASTNGNSSAAIIRIAAVIRNKAARLHIDPPSVGASPNLPVLPEPTKFVEQGNIAAARNSAPILHVMRSSYPQVPAIAYAQPSILRLLSDRLPKSLDNFQLTIFPSC
jgi:hypothetical protein